MTAPRKFRLGVHLGDGLHRSASRNNDVLEGRETREREPDTIVREGPE
jgi:hypothetical protein